MITLFFRKKREGVNSIEMVYSTISNKLLSHESVRLPYEGGSPIAMIKNILYAYRHKSEINHITGDAHYVAIGLGRNTILTIHDVSSALVNKNIITRLYVLLFWFWLPAIIVRRITVISEFTKKELSAVVPFAKKKIVVVHNAFNRTIQYSEKEMNRFPVILHMGTKPNKNLERVIEALGKIHCSLIIVGKLTPKQISMLDEKGTLYENHYDVSYDEIASLYRRCDIVSFPSLYEGFGLPILEANAAGRPIISGDIETLREVGADAACFVDPYSVRDIRDGFVKLIRDEEYRKRLVVRGLNNLSRFSPEIIAEKYNKIYMELMHDKSFNLY